LKEMIKKFKKDQVGSVTHNIPLGIADMEANFIHLPLVTSLSWIENLVTQNYEFLVIGLQYVEPSYFWLNNVTKV